MSYIEDKIKLKKPGSPKGITPKERAIRVRSYDTKTKEYHTWNSIYQFRTYYSLASICSATLEQLKNGKLVRIKHTFLIKKEIGISLRDLIEKRISKLHEYKKSRDLKELKHKNTKIYNNSILILDENFTIKGIWTGLMKDLAKEKGISETNMKSLLHRFSHRRELLYNGKGHTLYSDTNGENYCYLIDYL